MDTQTTEPQGHDHRHGPMMRDPNSGMVTGTADAIASYLGTDPNVVRVGFAALTVLGGAGIPLYLAAWLLIPEEGRGRSIAADLLDRTGFSPSHSHS